MRVGRLILTLWYLSGGLGMSLAVVGLWHAEHPVWAVIVGMIAASWFAAFIEEAHQIDRN